MRVLVLNPGSSSLKSSVVESSDGLAARPDPADPMASVHARPTVKAAPPPIAQADIDWGVDATADSDPADDFRRLLGRIEAEGAAADSLGAVGYRVVHGGSRFRQAVLVTPKVIEEIDELRSLAPLHNGVAVATMKAGLAALPRLPHVAVFDTAFHATLPEDAYRYAVPERWYRDWGVRRYGFHGMSVEWSVERTAQLLASPVATLRLVVAHLGSGCSVTATDGGQSAATSMGMTPLEGLMMGTRSGSIGASSSTCFETAGSTATSSKISSTIIRGCSAFRARPPTSANCWRRKPPATSGRRSRSRCSCAARPNASLRRLPHCRFWTASSSPAGSASTPRGSGRASWPG